MDRDEARARIDDLAEAYPGEPLLVTLYFGAATAALTLDADGAREIVRCAFYVRCFVQRSHVHRYVVGRPNAPQKEQWVRRLRERYGDDAVT